MLQRLEGCIPRGIRRIVQDALTLYARLVSKTSGRFLIEKGQVAKKLTVVHTTELALVARVAVLTKINAQDANLTRGGSRRWV
jgi:hypothetical protein